MPDTNKTNTVIDYINTSETPISSTSTDTEVPTSLTVYNALSDAGPWQHTNETPTTITPKDSSATVNIPSTLTVNGITVNTT
jgi:hypothetical protein